MLNAMQESTIIASCVVLGLLIVVGIPTLLAFRHAARGRDYEHAERMKALELGRPFPGERTETVSNESSSSLGGKIGIWVPIAAMAIALASSESRPGHNDNQLVVWIAAAAIGATGVICGTILAIFERSAPPRRSTSWTTPAKPTMEDDALDVVSRRG